MLLMAVGAMDPAKRLIHVFLDNARYHHAKPVQQWVARSGCRIRLHFIPSYCPHPWSASRRKPIDRLWGLMHRHCTHNKCYAGFKDFSRAILSILRERVPRNWRVYCDEVTDSFRVIDPADFRVLAESGYKGTVGHPTGRQFSVRRRHGRSTGRPPPAVRPGMPRRVPGRDLEAIDRRNACADPGEARAPDARRLRV
jgi:transposase